MVLIYNYRLQVNFAPPSLALASCNIVRLCRERFCKAGSSPLPTLLIISIQSSFTSSLLPKVSFLGEIKRGIIARGGRWSGFAPLLPTTLGLQEVAANAGNVFCLRKPVEPV